MSKVCILAVIAYGYFHVVQGKVFTEYEQHPVDPMVGVLQCGLNATAFDYCAVREANGTCYPLTTDWCQSKNMSVDGNYLIKKTVVESFQIYLDKADEILEWTYPYHLPPESVIRISSYFIDAPCDLFKVTYKSGQ